MVSKNWIIKKEAPEEFRNKFPEFSLIVQNLLWQRGISTQKEIDEFFNPDYESDLHDPFLMKDMQKAIERIVRAIVQREKIIVYGDYDADGVSGSTILISTIHELAGNEFPVSVYIPDRSKEGYGVNIPAVEEFAKSGVGLVITVDCGSTNVSEIALAQGKGIDIIITDHHQVLEEVPPAHAFVNPHQKDDTYPFKDLCGAGVAFKVAQALLSFIQKDPSRGLPGSPREGWEKWMLDLVALATVADMMPLLGENRTLVHYGLYVMAHQKRLGLRELMKVAGVHPTLQEDGHSTNLTPQTIGFILAPRINSAGRIDHANTAYALLTTQDEIEAQKRAQEIEETNRARQTLVSRIFKEADVEYAAHANDSIIFLGDKGWSLGVLGIVAGKFVEKYYKPAFIYEVQDGGIIAGSARTVEGLNIVEALTEAKDVLLRYGGHPQAGGFSCTIENKDELQRILNARAQKIFAAHPPVQTLSIDAKLSCSDIDWDLYEELKKFEPYGIKNPQSVFVLENMRVASLKKIGKTNTHVVFQLEGGEGFGCKALAFSAADREDLPKEGEIIDCACKLEIDEWNGQRNLMLQIVDFKKAD